MTFTECQKKGRDTVFCKNCGKEIGEAKFCQYCGTQNSDTPTQNDKDLFTRLKVSVNKIGYEKLLKYISLILGIISVIIRFLNNETQTVYNFLAQDDYLVISANGRNYILIALAIQIVLSFFFIKCAKQDNLPIAKKTYILPIVSVVVMVLAMVIKLPAPY